MILVTGAAGYVGSHIVRRLAEAGQPVRALVRNRAWAQAEGRLANLKIEWVEGDVTKPETLAAAMRGVDTVIHTVAIAIEKGGRKYETINYQGTVHVVDAAAAAGVKRFINISELGADARLPYRFLASKGKALSGNGDFSVQASWQVLDWQSEIGRTIRGKGTLSLRDGSIRSKSVLSVVLKAFQKPDLFPYEQILTNFRLADEKVFNDDILVNGKEFDLNIKGWTSLVLVPAAKGNPLEYSVKGNLLQKAVRGDAGKVLSILGGGETVLPVAIAGTVQNPTATVKMPKAKISSGGSSAPRRNPCAPVTSW